MRNVIMIRSEPGLISIPVERARSTANPAKWSQHRLVDAGCAGRSGSSSWRLCFRTHGILTLSLRSLLRRESCDCEARFHTRRFGTRGPSGMGWCPASPVYRSGASVFFQSSPFQDQTELHKRRHRVWYLCDVGEVDSWKTIFWQCFAANSPTSYLGQSFCSPDLPLAQLLPSVGGAAYASSPG
jgi:hypothetical protein